MFFIAEVGSNHDGDLERAKKLIDIAVEAKADAVKFQLIGSFKKEWIDILIKYCGDRIEFMATPFNDNGIKALKGKVKHWKIASTEAADPKFVEKVIKAAGNDTVYISDGAVDEPNTIIKKNVIPLACVVKYPALEGDYALGYHGIWGLSDHTQGMLLGVIAISAGACVVEKHFTDDKTRKGDDHAFALNPEELKKFVSLLRGVEILFNRKKLTIKDYVGRKIQWE
jgi:N,N'-diacetyllegionaminate synthase